MAPAESILQLIQRRDTFGTWRFQTDSGEVWWSPNVYKIHGLRPRKGPVDIERAVKAYHPDDVGTVNFLIEQALENKKGFEFVQRLTRADGKVRFVESVGMVKEDSLGNVVFVYGTIKDITDEVSEKEISKTRGMLVNSIVTNSPTPLVIVDRKMNYLQISPSWAKFHRITNPGNFIGKSHYALMKNIPEEWKTEHQRALKGEIIHRTTTLRIGQEAPPDMFGSVVFPWRTGTDKVGGLIIMVTSLSNSEKENAQTAARFANLIGRSQPLDNTPHASK
ncbi:MAG: PAS domain-containing protein [Hyphomicrobiales bacterium]